MDDYRQSDEFTSEIEAYEAELVYRQQNIEVSKIQKF